MADTLALEALYNAVSARFTAEGTGAANLFGWRVPAQQKPGSRCIWIPGDPSGKAGTIGGAKWPGRNPRPIANFVELFTVDIVGVDPNAGEDELAQYKVTRLLADAWYRAVYLAAHGTFTVVSEDWIIDRKERRKGTALRVVCTIDSMIPDEPLAGAPITTRAVIEVDELDEAETLEVGDAPYEARAASTSQLITLMGEQTVDGVALVDGDKILVAGQGVATENGPYIVRAGAWERDAVTLAHGFFVHVDEGTANAEAGFELQTEDPIVVDTTPLSFVRMTPAP